MTPKERALKIIQQHLDIYDVECIAIPSALITVDTVRNLCWNGNQVGINHWNDVRKEIEYYYETYNNTKASD